MRRSALIYRARKDAFQFFEGVAMLIGHEIAHQMLRHHVNLGTHTRFVVQAVFSFMKNDCCSSDLSGKSIQEMVCGPFGQSIR